MVVLMAAADFWKSASQTKEIYSAIKSNNPIRSMHSDIVVIEASVFFLYNFVDFVLSAIKNGFQTAIGVGSRFRGTADVHSGSIAPQAGSRL
jgi:hypothetical protein